MKSRIRRLVWDTVIVLAVIGIIYGVWDMIAARGFAYGFPMALLMAIFGMIAVEVLYPLWFGHD